MHTIQNCPICASTGFQEAARVLDYTVSHETFTIQKCDQCGLLITSPRPETIELGKYYESKDYVSHNASSPSLFDKVYYATRELALRWKVGLIKKYTKGTDPTSIFDYGCGTGHFLEKLRSNGFLIAGMEPSDRPRAEAEKINGMKIAASLAEIRGTYDVITLWHVLEHVADLNETVAGLKSKLRESGTLIVAVPNHKSGDASHYGNHWAGYDVPRHLWHFDQHTMTTLLDKHGLTLIGQHPMKLDAFYVSMLSEKYKRGRQTLATFIKGAFHGLLSNLSARNNNYSSIIYIARRK